ncbi:MAG: hypothetical protein ACR2N7_12860 [Acidimicrobiia bacterium]
MARVVVDTRQMTHALSHPSASKLKFAWGLGISNSYSMSTDSDDRRLEGV